MDQISNFYSVPGIYTGLKFQQEIFQRLLAGGGP